MELEAWFDALTPDKVCAMKGEPESQILDCKAVGQEKDMKRNLAVLLSGFANAQGGVCLWGVDARKNAEGVDCLESFPGVQDANLLASRLDELTPPAVSPGVMGVRHKALKAAGLPEFVATLVPASDGGPHMARFGEDRFYQRIGLSFIRMEQFQIADMFGRRARPSLKVSAVYNGNCSFLITLRNVGRGAAQAPFLQISTDAPFERNTYGVDGNTTEVLPIIRGGAVLNEGWLHAGGADFVIHPTMSVSVGGVWLGHLTPQRLRAPLPTECIIRYKAGALGIAPIEGTLVLPVPPYTA